MTADVIALDNLYSGLGYGISNSFTGDTTYGFNTNISISVSSAWHNFTSLVSNSSFTITDSGGTDTLDLSGFSNDQTVNLQTPALSETALIPSTVGDGNETQNLFFSPGTIIENTFGGTGNDNITKHASEEWIR